MGKHFPSPKHLRKNRAFAPWWDERIHSRTPPNHTRKSIVLVLSNDCASEEWPQSLVIIYTYKSVCAFKRVWPAVVTTRILQCQCWNYQQLCFILQLRYVFQSQFQGWNGWSFREPKLPRKMFHQLPPQGIAATVSTTPAAEAIARIHQTGNKETKMILGWAVVVVGDSHGDGGDDDDDDDDDDLWWWQCWG